ncbi:hypothetical protein ACWDSL_19835 [Streptomyces sp. NPDC000941]
MAIQAIGAASSTVTFFRSLGGTVGVSVLGAVLARQVQDQVAQGMAAAGLSGEAGAQSTAGKEIVQVAYGDATAHIFLISAAAAALAVVAAVLLRPVRLRSSLDLPDKPGGVAESRPAEVTAD